MRPSGRQASRSRAGPSGSPSPATGPPSPLRQRCGSGSSSRCGVRSARATGSSRSGGNAVPGPGRVTRSRGSRGLAAPRADARAAHRAAAAGVREQPPRPRPVRCCSPHCASAKIAGHSLFAWSVSSYAACPPLDVRVRRPASTSAASRGSAPPWRCRGAPAKSENRRTPKKAVAQDQQRPALADDLEGARQRAVLPGVVGSEGHGSTLVTWSGERLHATCGPIIRPAEDPQPPPAHRRGARHLRLAGRVHRAARDGEPDRRPLGAGRRAAPGSSAR